MEPAPKKLKYTFKLYGGVRINDGAFHHRITLKHKIGTTLFVYNQFRSVQEPIFAATYEKFKGNDRIEFSEVTAVKAKRDSGLKEDELPWSLVQLAAAEEASGLIMDFRKGENYWSLFPKFIASMQQVITWFPTGLREDYCTFILKELVRLVKNIYEGELLDQHDVPLDHTRICPSNIMVTTAGVKIGFGLNFKLLEDSEKIFAWPLPWPFPPAGNKEKKVSWYIGLLAVELFYGNFDKTISINQRLHPLEYPFQPIQLLKTFLKKKCSEDFEKLLLGCLEIAPNSRPTFNKLSDIFEAPKLAVPEGCMESFNTIVSECEGALK